MLCVYPGNQSEIMSPFETSVHLKILLNKYLSKPNSQEKKQYVLELTGLEA